MTAPHLGDIDDLQRLGGGLHPAGRSRRSPGTHGLQHDLRVGGRENARRCRDAVLPAALLLSRCRARQARLAPLPLLAAPIRPRARPVA